MKIGITTGSPENNLALLLINELLKKFPSFELYVITTESLGKKNALRRNGIAKAIRLGKNKLKGDFLDNKVKEEIGPVRSLYTFCKKKKIEYIEIKGLNSNSTHKKLKSYGFDYVINCGGGIFKDSFIAVAKHGVLNTHMGKLPEVRGMNALEWSVINKVPLGVTLHYIDEGIDTGPIIDFQAMEILQGDSLTRIRDRSNLVNVEMLIKAFRKAEENKHPIPYKEQGVEEGKQYYILHPCLKSIVERKINL